ncbi:hypothetical protein BGZ76_000472 [Entomortierella beljakovae]|nr:hypothetical protein BGZ76_000472 [Entomortierella beljakovae]
MCLLRAYSPFVESLTTYYASFFHLVQTHQPLPESPQDQVSTNYKNTLTSCIDQSIYNTYRFNNITILRALSLIDKNQNHENNCKFLFPLLDVVESCTKLAVLEIGFFKYDKIYISRLGKVIENHASLKDFTLNANDQRIFNPLFCQLVQHCRRLQRLDLSCIPIIAKKLNWIPDDQDLEVEPYSFSRTSLKELDLRHSNFTWVEEKTLIPLLVQCPDLERLEFPLFSSYFVEEVCDIIRSRIYNLKHVSFESFHRWPDSDVSNFIESCAGITATSDSPADSRQKDGLGGLETFESMDKKRLGERTIASLVCCHRMTLQYIDVRSGIDGYMMELILRSCINLTVFKATINNVQRKMWVFRPYVAARILPIEIRVSRSDGISCTHKDKPFDDNPDHLIFKPGWACTKLKTLGLQYSDTEVEIIPKGLYTEIAKLRYLEKLQLSRNPDNPQKSEGSSEDQASAITEIRLKTLTEALDLFRENLHHLQSFQLNNHESKTHYDIIKVIKRSLPRLSSVYCGDY